jgi:hypothetical protein
MIWAAAVAVGVVAVVGVVALFRGAVTPLPARTPAGSPGRSGPAGSGAAAAVAAPAPASPSLQLVRVGGTGGDPALAEDVALFDPATLFLPTRWNSSYVVKAVSEPGDAFGGFPPDLIFPESAPVLDLPRAPMPASPGATLADDPPGLPLLGFGRTPERVAPLAGRGGFVEIFDAATGRSVFAETLPEAAPPADAPWQPMEFLAAVDPAGLVGPLIATVSSGARPVDSYFRRYLAETLRVGARLAPGFYRISVGP